MIDWVDYLDTHFLRVAELDSLYERDVKQGPARGLWQTEIGDRYMLDEHYLMGATAPREDAVLTWNGEVLNIVPSRVNGADKKPPRPRAYLVVRATRGKSA
jgi:hypothetical protein